MKTSQEDQKHMEAVIEQAKLDERIFKVGTRIIKNGDLLAEAHGLKKPGQPGIHAEFAAIQICEKQGKDLRGATLYTTLEPCIHARSRPSTDCAIKIDKSGITEVVVGILDPNSTVCSRGVGYLEQNGVGVRRFPERLREKIEDLSIDFIEREATEVDTERVHHSSSFTEKGEARPVLGFADDLTPDLPDIRGLVQVYRKRRVIIPRILWPHANEVLWRNALKQRQWLLEGVRFGTTGGRSAELRNRDFEWVNHFIRDAWKIRTRAASRIPKMWRGMAPSWGWSLASSFDDALASFLVFCNTNILLALARAEKWKARPLFPPARRWAETVTSKNLSLSPVYQEVFSSLGPFYQVAVSKLGNWRPDPDRYVYVPKAEAMLMLETLGKHRIDYVSSRYMVPSVEYSLIGEGTIVEYGFGEWRRILDDHGQDAKLFSDSSLGSLTQE